MLRFALSIGPRAIPMWSEVMRNRFIASVSERLAGYIDDGGLAIPKENHFLTAMR